MKYLRTFENHKYEYEIGDYVKYVPGIYENDTENNIYIITDTYDSNEFEFANMNKKSYLLENIKDEKDQFWNSLENYEPLTELEMSALKYNL